MREPDEIIGENYLQRWHLIPRNRWFNVYLHRFEGTDMGRAPHDHPWWSVSIRLTRKAEAVERYTRSPGDPTATRHTRVPWLWPVIRSARHVHQMTILKGPMWTLFITGPKVREWGFWSGGRFIHWQEYKGGPSC